MSEACNNPTCGQQRDGVCIALITHLCAAHKPDPNESPSSPRTSGSPTASRSDSCIEGTGTQLAPVLRPEVGASSQGGASGCEDDCETCEFINACPDQKLISRP